MEVVLLRGAEADLLELYVRAEEKQIGAGDRLYGMVDGALTHLRKNPEIAPVYRGVYRRLVLPAFGIGIFYSVEAERLMIGALLDLRQDPKSSERRL